MPSQPDRRIGRLAIAVGVVAFASWASLMVYFVVGGPFGTINDVGNAVIGSLSAVLAWALRGAGAATTRGLRMAAVGAAVVGAVLTVVGSALVMSETTGWFLAGLVSGVGFAVIGLWLITLNRGLRGDSRGPRRLATLGVAAGAIMAFGLVAVPGIVMGLDDAETAPAWIWIGNLGWLGTYVLYPIWSIWLGQAALTDSES